MFPGNTEILGRMSIIDEGPPKRVRMANLSIVGTHTVNGVAFVHSQLIKEVLFKDFFLMVPKKFKNITNGVTPRRWIVAANPWLTALYDKHLVDEKDNDL